MDKEKHVDESWKESATRDKENLDRLANSNQKQSGQSGMTNTAADPQSHQQGSSFPESKTPESKNEDDALFLNYISSIVYQSIIFLGEIPHPATHQIEKNLEQAKLLIDTLIMLREKTKGNLSSQENDFLSASIYELQMKFLEISKRKPNT